MPASSCLLSLFSFLWETLVINKGVTWVSASHWMHITSRQMHAESTTRPRPRLVGDRMVREALLTTENVREMKGACSEHDARARHLPREPRCLRRRLGVGALAREAGALRRVPALRSTWRSWIVLPERGAASRGGFEHRNRRVSCLFYASVPSLGGGVGEAWHQGSGRAECHHVWSSFSRSRLSAEGRQPGQHPKPT